VESPTLPQIAFLVLSTLCFAWMAAGSMSALVGFIRMMSAKNADTIDVSTASSTSDARTALLFPVYREDAAELAARIEATCRDIGALQAGDQFDAFILSDTQDPDERSAEQRIFSDLSLRLRDNMLVYYRWRTPNLGKKAGNIREWIERFGDRYDYFVVLDADSIMSADTLSKLVATMDAHPRVGLIQTVPRLVGGTTLFALLQQFAAAVYGPVVSAGLAAWHGGGGNYWGHNAIIRTAAFADCAGLPALPGKPPLGGPIMSHDFVEAALLRRGGWEVHMVPSLDGSYEGCPPTLTDLIVRDRRWAQGNLQHLRVMKAHGLPILSRIHLVMGAFSYLASPLWAMTLIVGTVLALQAAFAIPKYFGTEMSLFPKWPVFDAQTALALFIATMFVVHLPKLMGGVLALRNEAESLLHGGLVRVIGGIIVETVLSTLIAPVLMVTQTSAVIGILAGRDAGWSAQRRTGSGTSFGSYIHQYRYQLLWGGVGSCVCFAISPAILAWMSPIVGGLLLAPVIAYWSARPAGPVLSRLLATPEERYPPRVLTRLSKCRVASQETGQRAAEA
jgi:membrane glycosyltransferase